VAENVLLLQGVILFLLGFYLVEILEVFVVRLLQLVVGFKLFDFPLVQHEDLVIALKRCIRVVHQYDQFALRLFLAQNLFQQFLIARIQRLEHFVQ
jgi:hypothetical protein